MCCRSEREGNGIITFMTEAIDEGAAAKAEGKAAIRYLRVDESKVASPKT
jgi:hypothetical protein